MGVRALRTQSPQAHHSNLVSALLALQSPGAADLLHVEKRWVLVFQASLTSLARQQICAPGVPGVSLRTPRQPSGRRENVGEVPGGRWIINPVQGALSTRRDTVRGREGRGWEIKSQREPSLRRKHFFCRHVLASPLPPAKGACSSDPDLAGSETCSWRSPEPLHGESEVPASALKAGQRLDPISSRLRRRLIPQPSCGGSQEVRQGSPRGWGVGGGKHLFPIFPGA